MRERCQYHARHVRRHLLDVTGNGKGIVVGITRHADDQIDVSGLQYLISLFRRTDLCERRRIAHTQFRVLVEEFLVDAPVVLQHEGVVRIGYYQYVEDATCHQVDE